MDSFWAIQRGYGYGQAERPSAPAAMPMWNQNGWNGEHRQTDPGITGSIPAARKAPPQSIRPAANRRPARPAEPAR